MKGLFSKMSCVIFFLFLCVRCYKNTENDLQSISKDNAERLVDTYLTNATNRDNEKEVRISNSERALYLLDKNPNDISKRKDYTKVSLVYLELKDSLRFMRTIDRTIRLSQIIKDSAGTAFNYNSKAIFYKQNDKLDSAYTYYSRAEKIYAGLGNEYGLNHGKSLLGMAIIQRQVKDYTESSSLLIEAIKKFKLDKEPSYHYLSICSSYLGMVANNLGEYDKAIEYHKESIDYAISLKNKDLKEILAFNNIGIVYKNQQKYTEAIEYYNKALKYEQFLKKDQPRYALLLDNLAYMKFLSGEREGIYELFMKALTIRDSIEDKSGISINTLHLSEYYKKLGNDSLAKYYAERSRDVSKSVEYNTNLLESYKILSEVSDSKEGLKYANLYIRLNDSLVKEERTFRDKFARIEYETDQIAEENLQISRENEILVIAVLGLTALFLLVYIIFRQQQSNKELLFAQSQQESNQEIYRLLLNQQVKLEEGRQMEQQRMSEELHDGVLGRLFGVRLSLDGINQRANDGFTEARTKYIEELKAIEKEIRLISHDLGTETLSPEVAYIDAVESLISDLCEAHKIDFEFKNDENIDWEEVDDLKKVNLFRILQESLQNIFKHAKAKMIKINFEYVNDKINLIILDDGIGFKSTKVKRGIGLKNITSRVSQMSGVVDFISNKDAGTTVSVSVPI